MLRGPRAAGVRVLLAGAVFSAAAAAADLPTLRLTFRPDGRFEPDVLEVPAGRFKIELVNASDQPVEFESLPLRKEKVLGPGVTSFVVITVKRPGRYPFFDDFHPDVKGELVVVPARD